MNRWRLALALAVIGCAPPAYSQVSEPRYKLGSSGKRVVQITNLAVLSDFTCFRVRTPMRGRVVRRNFGPDGLMIQSFVLEEPDGTRTEIRVDTERVNQASEVTRSWVLPGLQTLLRQGQTVSVSIIRCGASGKGVDAESIRLAR
jgi:hypothetical protein